MNGALKFLLLRLAAAAALRVAEALDDAAVRLEEGNRPDLAAATQAMCERMLDLADSLNGAALAQAHLSMERARARFEARAALLLDGGR